MSIISELAILSGKWTGENNLWISPDTPVHKSASTAEINTIANQQFTEISYTWAFEGEAQEGRIFISQKPEAMEVSTVWFDTWHNADGYMLLDGTVEANGSVSVKGSYPAPPGPDWGWQIIVEPNGKDAFNLLMHNFLPTGESMLAVEVKYSRQD